MLIFNKDNALSFSIFVSSQALKRDVIKMCCFPACKTTTTHHMGLGPQMSFDICPLVTAEASDMNLAFVCVSGPANHVLPGQTCE